MSVRIVVANPEKIPGGLKTIRTLLLELMDSEDFEVYGCNRRGKAPKAAPPSGFNDRYAHTHAVHALYYYVDTDIGIGFSTGNERVLFPWGRKRGHTELKTKIACMSAISDTGSSSVEYSCESNKNFSPEDVREMLMYLLSPNMFEPAGT